VVERRTLGFVIEIDAAEEDGTVTVMMMDLIDTKLQKKWNDCVKRPSWHWVRLPKKMISMSANRVNPIRVEGVRIRVMRGAIPAQKG
jgi:hypothetical protein